MDIPESEILAVIDRIERGDLSVTCDDGWGLAWTGVTFRTSDGWRFVVFNDGGQWDYIESVEAPDGRFTDSFDQGATPQLDEYAPATKAAAMRWGLCSEDAWTLIRFTHPPGLRGTN